MDKPVDGQAHVERAQHKHASLKVCASSALKHLDGSRVFVCVYVCVYVHVCMCVYVYA